LVIHEMLCKYLNYENYDWTARRLMMNELFKIEHKL